MTISKISTTNIESQSWQNIFDTMDNRSNIADPRDTQGLKTRIFIYDSDPFEKSLNFDDMPYIILKLPKVEYQEEMQSTDGKVKFITWTQEIVVRTVREGSSGGGTEDQGRTDIFAIGDDLQETFNKSSVREGLAANNVKKINLTKIDADTTLINQRDIYEASYELTYQTRMTVSS